MVLILLTAFVFYGVLPLWGAWRLRRSWNRFREAGMAALRSPEVDFSLLRPDAPLSTNLVRLTGKLEAIEGQDRFWIGNERVSMVVSLRGTMVYFLDEEPNPYAVGVEPPRRAEATSLGALPEGTQFLVWGSLVRNEQGQTQFASTPSQKLLVLAFEGSPQTVLSRAIYSGRAMLDHWNSWTPLSVGVGFLLLLVLAYSDLRPGGDHSTGLVGPALALLPSTFFLPPGILFFYGFARLWAGARDRRAQIDFARITNQPSYDQELNRRLARRRELAALGSLGLALLTNGWLLTTLLQYWIL